MWFSPGTAYTSTKSSNFMANAPFVSPVYSGDPDPGSGFLVASTRLDVRADELDRLDAFVLMRPEDCGVVLAPIDANVLGESLCHLAQHGLRIGASDPKASRDVCQRPSFGVADRLGDGEHGPLNRFSVDVAREILL